jgi:hypothetical protein
VSLQLQQLPQSGAIVEEQKPNSSLEVRRNSAHFIITLQLHGTSVVVDQMLQYSQNQLTAATPTIL